MTTTTEPATVPDTTDKNATHRFIGNPLHGPCLCGKPYASPTHHEQPGR